MDSHLLDCRGYLMAASSLRRGQLVLPSDGGTQPATGTRLLVKARPPVGAQGGDTPARAAGRAVARIVVRSFPRRFGLLEILAIGSLEWMRRHLAIVNALEAIRVGSDRRVLRVLDFGGADGSLGRALRFYGLADHYALTLVDIDRQAIEQAAIRPPIQDAFAIDPNEPLPFADRSFDIVVSSDVFEHIPGESRQRWALELARVGRLAQVHSMPLDSADGRWASSRYDLAYAEWLRATGRSDRWTMEHLENGVPTLEAVRDLFEQGRVYGIANGDVWLRSMRAQAGPKDPISRLLFAAQYVFRLRRLDRLPPFKNALVVVDARPSEQQDGERE